MGLELLTPPTAEPLTLADARVHLRVDTGDDDDLIIALITAAREYAETFTGRAFITQQWQLILDAFPGHRHRVGDGLWMGYATAPVDTKALRRADTLPLPKPNLLSVESVTYIATDGTLTTLDPSLYSVDTSELPGRLALTYGNCWPETRCQRNAVTVDFTAGYGANATFVPRSIAAAMKLLVGHLYENREAVALSRYTVSEVPLTVDALLTPHRVVEFR